VKALIVYDSLYGNTEKIAKAIGRLRIFGMVGFATLHPPYYLLGVKGEEKTLALVY